MPFISQKELKRCKNQAFMEGYRIGKKEGIREAIGHKYTVRELRTIFGIPPIPKREEAE